MKAWSQFSRLHPSVQIVLIISVLALVGIAIITHAFGDNLVSLLLALIAMNSKHLSERKHNREDSSK